MSNSIIPPIPARLVQDADQANDGEGETEDDQATVDQDVAEATKSNERLDD